MCKFVTYNASKNLFYFYKKQIQMKFIKLIIILSILVSGCTSENSVIPETEIPLPKGDYFGLKADTIAQVFAEGIVSKSFQELNAVFSPDGNEFYFTIADAGRSFYTIVLYSKNKNGEWEGPEVAPFSGSYSDADPCFSPDGKKLYFISRRPLDQTSDEPKDFDIWMVERTENGWSAASNLGAPINTDKNEFYVSVTKEGSLFYSGEYEGGIGRGDIYEAKLDAGKYVVENLGAAINSPTGEGDPYVSPDGDMLIFMSWGRPEDLGRGDLYISFKKDGAWQAAKNLGPKINSPQFEYCPMMSPDGKYFFWTSYKTSPFHSKEPRTYSDYLKRLEGTDNGLGNVYWIKAEVLERFR